MNGLASSRPPTPSELVASEIAPRLYLTCLATATNVTQISNLGITHVVSIMESKPTISSKRPLRTLYISLHDSFRADILSHLPTTTAFIRDALAESPENRVLVHCVMGISRSATVMIAYLIATTKMTPREALAAVQSKRAVVLPNFGFMSQLQEYYMKYSDSSRTEVTGVPDDGLDNANEDGKQRGGNTETR